MANIAICSTSTPFATLPATVSISSPSTTTPTKSSSLKIPHNFHTHPLLSSANLNLDLDSDNVSLSTSTAAASDALALARESLASAYEVELSLCSGEGRNHELGRDWRNGCLVRRRKRRKRRKGSELESCDEDKVYPFMAAAATGKKPGKYLTSKEEAEYSMFEFSHLGVDFIKGKVYVV